MTLIRIFPSLLSSLFILSLFLLDVTSVYAMPNKVCIKSDTGVISVKRKCKAKKGFAPFSAETVQGLAATQVGPQGPTGPVGPQGATGAQGPVGPTGAQGSPGLLAVRVEAVVANTSSAGTYSYSAFCNAGEVAIGGGCRMTGVVDSTLPFANNPRTDTITSPNTDDVPTGWFCAWKKSDTDPTGFRTWAICGLVAP